MLLILIPIVWLAAMMVVVALCQTAARGDRSLLAASVERSADASAWEAAAPTILARAQDQIRSAPARSAPAVPTSARRRRGATARGVQTRAARSSTGS